ncbi:MAG: branched-chain amino acid ABC transporter permease, partial [Deltaproteobacteria bacterium]|nr:branched-chain amino acid ABC transporter permease [Deltaproteobacteria bacterium]
MEIFLQVLINGLIIGLLYVLMALGLTLIFGVMDVINFAHGEFYMLGAFFTYIATVKLQMPFVASLAFAVFVVAILAIVIEKIIFRPLIENPLNVLIISLALSILLQNISQLFF